jgi:hypothetical protein
MPVMLEVTVALVAVGLIGFGSTVLTPRFITTIGLGTLCLGIVMGVPTGFWYHVVLYRLVSAKVALPRGWWLSPSRLHAHLTEIEQRRVHSWYHIGGVGFVLCVVGGVAAIAGVLMTR